MYIFMTNDDGFDAPGIIALALELSKTNRVTVIAPETGVSSCSSALSLRKPMHMRKQNSYGNHVEVFSLTGTTGDCCKLALEYWMKEDMPDLIVSGINNGFNTGSDCLYSGTVAGALEGVFAGIPSVAVSVENTGDKEYLQRAAVFSSDAVYKYFIEMEYKGILNINIPKLEPREITWRNTKVAPLGLQLYSNVIAGHGENGSDMEFIMSGQPLGGEEPETDVYWSRRGLITVTPLQWNQTDEKNLVGIKEITATFVD